MAKTKKYALKDFFVYENQIRDDVSQISDRDRNFSSFFYKSKTNILIVLLICYKKVDNSKLTYENICSSIVSRFKSRTTIKNVLNEGVVKGFFIKKKCSVDPRNKNYTPSIPVELFMKNWIKKERKIFKK